MCNRLNKILPVIIFFLISSYSVFAQTDTLKSPSAQKVENTITTLATGLPTITIAASTGNAICSGTIITFRATIHNPVGYPSYQWQVNGKNVVGNDDEPLNISTLNNGDIVTCIMTNLVASIPPIVSAPYVAAVYPTPTITLKDITIIKGNSVNLNPVITGSIFSYSWTLDGSNGTIASLSGTSIANPVATPITTTTYRLQVISTSGCAQAATVTVNVVVPIVVPTAFTPNGDGVNDLWNIKGLPDYKLSTVNIFNRYGYLVYKSVGYANSWDGNLNGKALPAGTYYYIIDPKTGDKVLSGWVEIVR